MAQTQSISFFMIICLYFQSLGFEKLNTFVKYIRISKIYTLKEFEFRTWYEFVITVFDIGCLFVR